MSSKILLFPQTSGTYIVDLLLVIYLEGGTLSWLFFYSILLLVCMWLFHLCRVLFCFLISRGQRIFPRRTLLSVPSTDLMYLNVFSSFYPTSGFLGIPTTYYWRSHQRETSTTDVVVHYITCSLWFCLKRVDRRGNVHRVKQPRRAQVLCVTLAGLF